MILVFPQFSHAEAGDWIVTQLPQVVPESSQVIWKNPYVLWCSKDGLFLYDIRTRALKTITNSRVSPSIINGDVVYSNQNRDLRSRSAQLFVYNIADATLTPIPQLASIFGFACGGGVVVWNAAPPSVDLCIYDTDRGKVTQIKRTGKFENDLATDGKIIVWVRPEPGGVYGGARAIFTYDIASGGETRIAGGNGSTAGNPVICGSSVLFAAQWINPDKTTGGGVFRYDLAQHRGTQIGNTFLAGKISVSPDGQAAAWSEAPGIGNPQVRFYDLRTGKSEPMTHDEFWNIDVMISNRAIAWNHFAGGRITMRATDIYDRQTSSVSVLSGYTLHGLDGDAALLTREDGQLFLARPAEKAP
jgi:hypothetical protein